MSETKTNQGGNAMENAIGTAILELKEVVRKLENMKANGVDAKELETIARQDVQVVAAFLKDLVYAAKGGK